MGKADLMRCPLEFCAALLLKPIPLHTVVKAVMSNPFKTSFDPPIMNYFYDGEASFFFFFLNQEAV